MPEVQSKRTYAKGRTSQEIQAEMNAGLERAVEALPQEVDAKALNQVAKWVAKWYTDAGYKKLARFLRFYQEVGDLQDALRLAKGGISTDD